MTKISKTTDYTPGEWTIDCGDLVMGGQVIGRVPAPDDASPEERRANGFLIAAAPKMQALLTEVLFHLSDGIADGIVEDTPMMAKVRSILAISKGE